MCEAEAVAGAATTAVAPCSDPPARACLLASPATVPIGYRKLRRSNSLTSTKSESALAGLRRVNGEASGWEPEWGNSFLREGLTERVAETALAAFDMLWRPSMHVLGVGLACMICPLVIIWSALIVLPLIPLLLPLGFTLTLVGLARAWLVASMVCVTGRRGDRESDRETQAMRGKRTGCQGSCDERRTEREACIRAWATHADSSRLDSIGGRVTSVESLSPMVPADGAAVAGGQLPSGRLVSGQLVSGEVSTEPNLNGSPLPRVDGSLSTLNTMTAQRGERLIRQIWRHLRSNLGRASREIGAEIRHQLVALQRELQSWVGANPNLKPYCHGRIGWLLRSEVISGVDLTKRFDLLLGRFPPPPSPLREEELGVLPLPEGVHFGSLSYLIVPGLLTKWYPKYMNQLRGEFKRLNLDCVFSKIDTDQPVRVNAARILHEVRELHHETGRRVIILGHSKGAVDAAAALSIFPELCPMVAALVSVQGPHGGSALAHDLAHTRVQRSVALELLERLLRGCRHAVLDLSFSARQEFLERHPPKTFLECVPTLCVASCDRRPNSLLKPVIDFVALRYGEWSDGCVCQGDAILPGAPRVLLDDMDHFGPAWSSFPATDKYEPTRFWLCCIALALSEGGQSTAGKYAPGVCTAGVGKRTAGKHTAPPQRAAEMRKVNGESPSNTATGRTACETSAVESGRM